MSFLKIGTRSRYALRFMIELAEVERAARFDETRRRGYVKLRTVEIGRASCRERV